MRLELSLHVAAASLFGVRRHRARRRTPDLDPRIAKLVASVSEERLGVILKKLESFGRAARCRRRRPTTRGIGAARQWIFDEMKSYSPKLQVSFDTYQVADAGTHHARRRAPQRDGGSAGHAARGASTSAATTTRSRRPGGQGAANAGARAARSRRAHRCRPPIPTRRSTTSAPGVNDDGSGTALTMELARVFSQSGIDFDATLVFMCHVGEEQGLIGARLHAQKAVDAEDSDRRGLQQRHRRRRSRRQRHRRRRDDPRLLRKGPRTRRRASWRGSSSAGAARYVPSHKVRLMARPDRFGRGGDHSAYNAARLHRGRLPRVARELHHAARRRATPSTASRCRTWRRTRASTPPPRRRWRSRRRRRACSSERNQPMITRAPSGYDAHLNWNAVAGRRRLSDLLARSVGTGLAARGAASATSPTLAAAEHADRRLRLRRRRGRRRRPRELRHRLRDAAPRAGSRPIKTQRRGLVAGSVRGLRSTARVGRP